MEKISGILPSTARITSVDLKNSGVARAGSPSFGRPQGLSSPARRELEASQLAAERHNEVMSLRQPNLPGQAEPKDPHVAIIEKMAKDFFMKPAAQVEAREAGLPVVDYGPSADLDPRTNGRGEDLDLPEVGGYLDVTV